jgi:hypothetical protein
VRRLKLPAFPGVIIKDSYWRWPERHLADNAIDLHVNVLDLSFHDVSRRSIRAKADAMRQITDT